MSESTLEEGEGPSRAWRGEGSGWGGEAAVTSNVARSVRGGTSREKDERLLAKPEYEGR